MYRQEILIVQFADASLAGVPPWTELSRFGQRAVKTGSSPFSPCIFVDILELSVYDYPVFGVNTNIFGRYDPNLGSSAKGGVMNHRFCFFWGVLFLIISIMSVAPVSAQTGGYSDVAVTNPEVIAAANFAVDEQAKKESAVGESGSFKLNKIISAKQQVVAGMNYDLQLKVKVRGDKKIAQAIVYKSLSGTYQLTSWVWK